MQTRNPRASGSLCKKRSMRSFSQKAGPRVLCEAQRHSTQSRLQEEQLRDLSQRHLNAIRWYKNFVSEAAAAELGTCALWLGYAN